MNNSPLGISLCQGCCCWGRVLTRTCGSWGIHLPHSGTL